MLNYDLIGRALIHPLQRRILEECAVLADDDKKGVSPNELSLRLDEPLGNVAYHVKVLAGGTPHVTSKRSKFAQTPLLTLVEEVPRRGAVEHYYALTASALAPVEALVPA